MFIGIGIVIHKFNKVRCLLLAIINNFTITQHQLSFPVCSVLGAGQSSSILTLMYISNIELLENLRFLFVEFYRVPVKSFKT